MTPLEGLTFWMAVVLYGAGFGAGIYGLVLDRGRLRDLSRLLVGAGLAAHAIAFATRYRAVGHIPTIGSYENILTGTLVIVALALPMLGRRGRLHGLVGTLPFVLLLMGFSAMSDPSPRPFIASLKSFWLYVHILFAWLAYAGYTSAAGVGVAYLVRSRRGEVPARFEELMFRLAAIGLITDAVMIGAGSIWARDLWGSYWSWDPVETWSLISFLLYGLILHLKVTLRVKGRVLAWMMILSLITVIITFWGVNAVMEKTYHVFTVD